MCESNTAHCDVTSAMQWASVQMQFNFLANGSSPYNSDQQTVSAIHCDAGA